MLMAAGLGTRMRPFTDRTPKPLVPVMGIPIAQYAVDTLRFAGIEKVVSNVHHLGEQTARGLRSLEWGGVSLELSREDDLLMGSAGGLKKALPALGNSPFFYVNADVICDVDLTELGHHHQKMRRQWGAEITLAVFPKSATGEAYRRIDLDHSTGLIQGFGDLERNAPYFISLGVIEPDALKDLPDHEPSDFVEKILRPTIARKKAAFFLCEGTWFDVGTPALWTKTHLSILDRLETGSLFQPWRGRIESQNQRIAPKVWVSSHTPASDFTRWVGPAYYSRQAGSVSPRELGPNAVLYGSVPSEPIFSNGIGYDGVWAGL